MYCYWSIDHHMNTLEELMTCRDLMEKCKYPFIMIETLNNDIDNIICEGMKL